MKKILSLAIASLFCTVASAQLTDKIIDKATRFEFKQRNSTYTVTPEKITFERKGSDFLPMRYDKCDIPADCYEYFIRNLKDLQIAKKSKGSVTPTNEWSKFTLNVFKKKSKLFSCEGDNDGNGAYQSEHGTPTHLFETLLEYCTKQEHEEAPTGKIVKYEYIRGPWSLPNPLNHYIVEMGENGNCKISIYDSMTDNTTTYNCSASIFDDMNDIVHSHLMHRYHRSYQPEVQVMDGSHWSLTIKYDNNYTIDSSGSNANSSDNGISLINSLILKTVNKMK